MRRVLSGLILILLTIGTSYAQDKEVVAVTPVTSSITRGARAYANSLTEVIVDGIVKSNRFRVVDRSNFDDILSEENLQKGESFIDGLVVEQGKKLGAQYIITGNLSSASADPQYRYERYRNRTRKVLAGYNAHVSFTMKVIDVETGEILGSDVFDNRSGGYWVFDGLYQSPEAAITAALKNARPHTIRFVDQHFPLDMKIFEIAQQKRGYAKEIVVTGGRNNGLKVGQWLKVVHVSRVNLEGKFVKRSKPLGWAQVVSVDDEYFSTCKVKRDGGDKIFELFHNDPENVRVMSGQ
ncbi:CsgG/HfaB family protein [Limibacter armeniacum]|uniref:CsgG/HfaB family protein n=1 Tax=Limibacter armeniacum TaxID=466084 RepID=UPI002FE634BA